MAPLTEPLDLVKLREIVDRYGSTMVELAPGTSWDEAGAIGEVLAAFPALLAQVEAAHSTGLEDAHAALASALLWLDGEYAETPRDRFGRGAWRATARRGLAALVAARTTGAVGLSAPVPEDPARLPDHAPGVGAGAAHREPELRAAIDAVADALNAWDQGEPPRPDTARHWSKIVSAFLEWEAAHRDSPSLTNNATTNDWAGPAFGWEAAMQDPAFVESLNAGLADLAAGRTVSWDAVKDRLAAPSAASLEEPGE